MKRIVYSVAALLLICNAYAQQCHTGIEPGNQGERFIPCHFDEYQRGLYNKHYDAARDHFEQWISSKIAAQKSHKGTQTAVYTLPVVFHIIYEDTLAVGVGHNIAAGMVNSQIQQLNADYGNLSGSRYPQAVNTTIQFALAQRDPQGNMLPEPGIDRVSRNAKGFRAAPYTKVYMDGVVKTATYWDPTKYINVWVVAHLDPGQPGLLAGYATFPVASGLPGLLSQERDSTAGVVMNAMCIGSLTNPYSGCASNLPYGKGRILSHEMGHFLGLRHTWGDAPSCAVDDFCGDTPRASGASTGCPKGANTCDDTQYGAPVDYPDMVENYMDYSSEVCLNTFTADQKSRMIAVLSNSPRRRELMTSTAGLTNTGQVSFVADKCDMPSYNIVTEDIVPNACPRYQDIPVSLQVYTAATGPAVLSFLTSGNARRGVDYDLVSDTLHFAAGDNSRNLMLRIYDNAIPEGAKTIRLFYTISGTGVTAGNTNQVIDVIIAASDQPIPISQSDIVLLNENFDAATELPVGWRQLLSGAAVTNRWTVSPNGGPGMTGNSAHVSNNYNAATPAGRTNTYTNTAASRTILSTPLIDATNFTDLKLSFKWRCVGDSSGSDAYDYGALSIAPAPDSSNFNRKLDNTPDFFNRINTQYYTHTLPNQYNNGQFYIGFLWLNDNIDGANPGFTIDDVQMVGAGLKIETKLFHKAIETIPVASAIRFISAEDHKLIAGISNASDSVRCVVATVADTGIGQVYLQTPVGSYKRSKKVIQVTPQVAGIAAAYNITLYFTREEMTGWSNPALLKVLQVKDTVALSGTITRQHAQIVVPVAVDDQLQAKGYIAYTCRTDGFGRFMLVQPETALPVPDVNGKTAGNIQLYPNPVKQVLSIEASGIPSATMEILNMAGQALITVPGVLLNNKYNLGVGHLPPGVYLLKVMSNKGAVFIKRWTKE